ncbi:predicted protein [Plenodomus lingam JN3]|uniref:Predicted protein n=1 Tax=Leptosphaeria maculans (strain JN3 / isolate v23.1.3 / race Av1-4-5-6-7-8) TaxID=985895 RepID=E5A8S7_LEPMJ|nr:predicted protein [Plenodomus lingam JN3]CBY00022.1 predicted protein [Plenodomus lingam JN3]
MSLLNMPLPPLSPGVSISGLSGARVLGARLLLLALEGAIDMLVCLFLLLLLLGREPADVLEESERT